MSDTTADDRDDAAPIAARPNDSCASYARPLGFVGLDDLGMASAVRLANRFPLLGCDQDPARLSLLVDMVERDSPRPHHSRPRGTRRTVRRHRRPAPDRSGREEDHLRFGGQCSGRHDAPRPGASHPAETRRLAAELSDRSVHLLDAALLGTELAARDGSLTILVGGAASVLGEAEPYLAHLGRSSDRPDRHGPCARSLARSGCRGWPRCLGGGARSGREERAPTLVAGRIDRFGSGPSHGGQPRNCGYAGGGGRPRSAAYLGSFEHPAEKFGQHCRIRDLAHCQRMGSVTHKPPRVVTRSGSREQFRSNRVPCGLHRHRVRDTACRGP